MFAQASAFDVLVLVLAVGFVAALFGWAGGWGARASFSVRVYKLEGYLLQILNRSKGAAGQQGTQATRERRAAADAEAEMLAAKLSRVGPKAAPRTEDEALAHWTAVAHQRKLAAGSEKE